MSNNQLKILEGFSKNFILSIINKADFDRLNIIDNDSLKELILSFKNDDIRMSILDVEYFLPSDYSDDKFSDKVIAFLMYGFFKPEHPTEKIYFTIRGSIEFDKLTQNEVEISDSHESITLINQELSTDSNEALNKFKAIQEILRTRQSENISDSNTTELENNILESSNDMNDTQFMEWLRNLLEISNHKQTRVWGEYNQVARITKEPVLMNKAMSIALTKEQVVGLINRLVKEYTPQLKAIKLGNFQQKFSATRGKIPVRFGVTTRGHASLYDFEINLPKLGDWRFGYTGFYSAELVFHEFAHFVDFGRKSSQEFGAIGTSTGRSDVHRHDFVHILDNMLRKNAEWINSKYSAEMHKDQILNNSSNIAYFYDNKQKIVSDIAKQEKALREKILSDEKELATESGITENAYPLSITLSEDKGLKVRYILWAIEQFKNGQFIQEEKNLVNKIGKLIENDPDVVLKKDEVGLLNKALNNINRSKFINTLSVTQQLAAMNPIKKFEADFSELIKGKIAQTNEKIPLVIIEDYEDFKIIPDDERSKILG